MTSKQLKKQIEELKLRQSELGRALEQAEAVNAECQQALVKAFTAEAQDRAASAFANYSSLKSALEAVERELETKATELEAMELADSQAAVRTRLKGKLREHSEVEETYRLSRVKSDQALSEHVGTQVDAHQRRQKLQSEIILLYRELGEQPPAFGVIQCLEPLFFSREIDAAAQLLLNKRRRESTTRDERMAAMRERSRREQEARQRAAAAGVLQYPAGCHPSQVKQPAVEPPRVIYGRMRMVGDVADNDKDDAA